MKHRFEIQGKRSRVKERPRQQILGLRTYTLQNHVHRGRRKRASQTICRQMLSCDTCKSRKPRLFRPCRLYARRLARTLIQTMNCLLFQPSDFLLCELIATLPVSPLGIHNLLPPKSQGSEKSSVHPRNRINSKGLQGISQPLALEEEGTSCHTSLPHRKRNALNRKAILPMTGRKIDRQSKSSTYFHPLRCKTHLETPVLLQGRPDLKMRMMCSYHSLAR